MRHKILFILIVLISFRAFGQSTSLNKQKYWDYRDRFKKWYININRKAGGSIPMQTKASHHYNTSYTGGGNYFPKQTTWMQWGDSPRRTIMYMGYYLATLSMEYKLLKKNGQDTKATLAEIYYVLEVKKIIYI